MTSNWFDVNKEGLAKILERRGKSFAVLELIQNAWDQDVSEVRVTLEPVPNCPQVEIVVEDDDPEGFKDLTHAWTLFAESSKADDPEKRGRFNLGEKMVLAICREAEIVTTKGGVRFDESGGRSRIRQKREQGSEFHGFLKMTRDELDETLEVVDTLIPPEGIKTTINGSPLARREVAGSFEATLPTVLADEEGYLKPTTRKTEIRVYEPKLGEEAMIYEMGIPIVETDDRWHVDIQQKVPLNSDRDNVRPAYLRKVRAYVLNEMSEQLTEDDSSENWISNALEDDEVEKDAVSNVLDKRFGKKRVAYDPSDPEANKLAVSQGYKVIHGRELSKKAWGNVKRFQGVSPAGQVTPSPKPYAEGGKPVEVYSEDEWTEGMGEVYEYTTRIAKALLGRYITVRFVLAGMNFNACYGSYKLDFNVRRLGKAYFKRVSREKLNDLLIHEFGHQFSCDHLSSDYHKALTQLGAQLTELALDKPELLKFR